MSDIERKRKERGWSQAELAERLGVDQSTVSRIETGQTPSKPVQKLLDTIFAEPSEQDRAA